MRTVTKKIIAGIALLACFIAVMTGIALQISPIAVLKRAIIATVFFGAATFLGGLIYEKIWRR